MRILTLLAIFMVSCTECDIKTISSLPPLNEWAQVRSGESTTWDMSREPTITLLGGENSLEARSSHELIAPISNPHKGDYTLYVTVHGDDSAFITVKLCRKDGSIINTIFFTDIPLTDGLKNFPIKLTAMDEIPDQIRVNVTSTSIKDGNKVTISKIGLLR